MNKHILIFDHDRAHTGSTVSLQYLLSGLGKSGFRITVCTTKSEKDAKIYESYDVRVVCMQKYNMLNIHHNNSNTLFSLKGLYGFILMIYRFIRGYFEGKNIIKEYKPDLVYLNEYVLLQYGLSAKKAGIPVLTHVRSNFINLKYWLRHQLIKKSIQSIADEIIAISPADANQFDTLEKVHEVYEFLNDSNFKNYDTRALKKTFDIPTNATVFTFLGGIAPYKGTLELLKAAERVLQENSDIYFLLAGTVVKNTAEQQKYAEACMNFIDKPELQTHIRFLGRVQNATEYIATGDVLISANTVSHFSRPAIEAWAQKKAVIISNVEHSKGIFIHNADALVYDTDNIQVLSENILKLAENSELRVKLAENGYNKAKRLFSVENNIKEIVDIFYTYIKN